jgi:hypothetical protein
MQLPGWPLLQGASIFALVEKLHDPALLSNKKVECAYGGAQVGTPPPVDEFGDGKVMLGHPANERIRLVFRPFALAGPSIAHCA